MSDIAVVGGPASLAADYEQLLELAGLLDAIRLEVNELSDQFTAPLMWELDGIGGARRPAALRAQLLLESLRSPWGLAAVSSAALQQCAARLFVAVGDYRSTDRSVFGRLTDELSSLAHVVHSAVTALPEAVVHAAALALTDPCGSALGLKALVTRDPALLDLVVDLTPVAAVLASAGPLPDGHAQVLDLGTDTRPVAVSAPQSLAELVEGLSLRNGGHDGEISVSFVAGPADEGTSGGGHSIDDGHSADTGHSTDTGHSADTGHSTDTGHGADGGHRNVIVDLPGTKSWTPYPTHDSSGVSTDVRAMSGAATTYERGVFEALDAAGVRPDDRIMLVGHSEGGIVAVDAAEHADPSRYRITHVVTVGSPIGVIARALPRAVQVLAIENTTDVVPHLDGADNPVLANLTTATVDEHHDGVGASHDLDTSYVPAADALDRCAEVTVQDFLTGAHGYLSGTTLHTEAFWVRRQ